MIIWGTVPTTRSVPTSITHRCGHHSRLLCFERFIYTLSTIFVDTLTRSFGHLRAQVYILLLILSFTIL